MNAIKEEIIEIKYCKSGEEKTIIFSSKEGIEAREIGHFSENGILVINKDVEVLQLKKTSLIGIKELKCQNDETIIRIEECELEPQTIFRNGKIILKIPVFTSQKGEYYSYHLLFCENEYVEFLLGKKGEYENHIFQIKGVKNMKITGNASKLIIREPQDTETPCLQNLYIKGATHYSANVLNAKNVTIEESEVDSIALLKYQTLSISNATVSSKNNYSVLNLREGKIKIKNSILEGKKIILPEGTFQPTNGSLTIKDKIVKENLLAVTEKQEEKTISLNDRPMQTMYPYYCFLKDGQAAEEYFKRVVSFLEKNTHKRARIRN